MDTASIEKTGFFKKNPVLKEKEFLYYLCIRFALIFALNMQSTTIYYWVYHITGDKLALGLVGLAEVIPAVGFSLVAGHLVDLHEKRKILLCCIIAYLLIGVGLYLLTTPLITNSFHLTHILYFVYAGVFLGGAVRAFMGPSSFSLVGLLVPRTMYPNATSWSSMAWQIGAVCGPLMGGFMLAWKGISFGMLTVVIMECLLLLPFLGIKPKPIMKKEREPIFQSLTEGLRFVWHTPALLSAQCLDMFSVLFGGAVALLPVYQKEILHVDTMGFGILRAAPGIGAFISLGLLAFFPLKKYPGKKLFAAVLGFGVCIIVFGISRNFYLSCFMLVLSGMFDAISVVIRGTILQLVTPDSMRGRVASVNVIFTSSSNELGDFESGLMAHWLGTVRAVVVGGSITLAVVAATFLKAKPLRRFTYEEKIDEK